MHVVGPLSPYPIQEECSELDPSYLQPPTELMEGGRDDRSFGTAHGRPIAALRSVAASLRNGTRTPEQILAEAAVELQLSRLGRGGSFTLGMAYADLTVSGRAAWRRFQARRPTAETMSSAIVEAAARRGTPVDEMLHGCVRNVLERAHVIAWNLRGPLGFREQSRVAQRWIASVSEEDPPHRPLNVVSAPFPQYDLELNVSGHRLTTRLVVASSRRPTSEDFDWSQLDLRTLPSEREVWIPEEDDIIVFIHGHSSRAEEGLAYAHALHREARRRNRSVTLLSFDLPGNGYTEFLDPEAVAPIEQATFHLIGRTRPPDATYPVLNLIEAHIQAVVAALDERLGIAHRIVGVAGGSLGGNMALRLGYRSEVTSSWGAQRASWSPASAWGPSWGGASIDPVEYGRDPYRYYDHIKHEAVRITRDRAGEAENEGRRSQYFTRVFDGVWPEPPQAPRWYRDGWPCKADAIRSARYDRMEIYNELYRRWHWRVAHEQLIYSHFDPITRGGRPRYESMQGRLLLMVGTRDNHFPEYIYDRVVEDMARGLGHLEGRAFGVSHTGHSLQAERPRYLATVTLDFFGVRAPEERVELRAVTSVKKSRGVVTHLCNPGEDWSPVPVAEAMADRHRYIVVPADESIPRRELYVRRFLTTRPDGDPSNNLGALPDCTDLTYGYPSSGVDTRVTSVVRSDGYWRTIRFLCNDELRWMIDLDSAIREITSEVREYYIVGDDGERMLLQPRVYFTTEPDGYRENNLDELPEC